MIQLCNVTHILTNLKVGQLLSMLGCTCRETDVYISSFFRWSLHPNKLHIYLVGKYHLNKL